MSKLKILDMSGASVGEVDLADELLELEKGDEAVHQVVRAHNAASRAGTASTLEKGEVAGSNKKPWRQKGTGRARAGYRQSPVWRGGSVVFGPQPRSYGFKVNRKVKRLAFKRAFSERVSEGQVKVVKELTIAEPKTKAFVTLMKSLEVTPPVLFVVDKIDKNIALATRNMAKVEVVEGRMLDVYHILRYPVIIISESGLEVLKQRLAG